MGPDDDRVPADRDGKAKRVRSRRVRRGELRHLRRNQWIDRHWELGLAKLHPQRQVRQTPGVLTQFHPRRKIPARGVVGVQIVIAQRRRPLRVAQRQAVASRRQRSRQRPRLGQLDPYPIGRTRGQGLDGEALLHASTVVDVPLGEPRPQILHAIPFHVR